MTTWILRNFSEPLSATVGLRWVRWLSKPLVFLVALLPAAWLPYALLNGQLGPNPVEAITDHTGEWALRFLLLGLLLTPLRHWLKRPWPVRFRRMIGLFAFFYLALHMTTYLWLDQQWDVAMILDDVVSRPYITAGVVALLILTPLALTSTRGMMRRLGSRWQSLHRWVYVAGVAAVLHYVWLARGDRIEPLIYLAILIVLLLDRFRRLAAR